MVEYPRRITGDPRASFLRSSSRLVDLYASPRNLRKPHGLAPYPPPPAAGNRPLTFGPSSTSRGYPRRTEEISTTCGGFIHTLHLYLTFYGRFYGRIRRA